ncbi:MAG TPA: THUMP domain-containing protein [Parachlamydiaceae bacterium]|nr:THUMP domain-containing protein [Parachlamydiaceae bacterium]
MSLKLFVSCSFGLEEVLLNELQSFGYLKSRKGYLGVHLEVPNFEAIYRINYLSRIAARVLLPLTDFFCYDQKGLYKGASKVDWANYIKPGKTIAIDANVNHKHLRNSLFAAQVVKDAICDQLREKRGFRPDIDVKYPDVQLNLFIHENACIISFDTSGSPLYKRGYRQETVEAPLQESLAAGLLMLAGYKGDEVLYDPCCGSGTFLIEAALIATNTAPGFLRKKWGFSSLPEFSEEAWIKTKAEIDQKRIPLSNHKIFGSDLNKTSLFACKLNLKAAGFLQEIEVSQGDVKEIRPPVAPNFIITNPPYGKRLEGQEAYLQNLYRAIGEFMKTKAEKPAKGFVFTGSLELAKQVGLASKKRHILNNGGIDSRFLEFDLY